MEWSHSFRMPVFFLISGFFGHMMLGNFSYPVKIRTTLPPRSWARLASSVM